MIKFDICGQTVLLYEVPYIAVPTLKDDAKITDRDIEKLDRAKMDDI